MPQTVLEQPIAVARGSSFGRSTLPGLAALTPAVLLIHGYHPYADDAGIYVAGIRKLLRPSLYAPDAPFVLASTHSSIFAHLLAAVIQVTHLRLSIVLLVIHLVSIFAFLLAAWMVASRLFARTAERWFAVSFAAACFTLPAAGTALLLMDPYVTARSFSTPFGLFAVAAALERRWAIAAMMVVLAAVMHPLMALYIAALVLLYTLVETKRTGGAVLLAVAGIAAAGLLAFASHHHPASRAYLDAIHSARRTFLFPSQWRWYEDAGIIIPVLIFALAASRAQADGRIRKLCSACFILGLSSTLAAFLFVHSSGPYLLVRLQLLRSFHMLYLIGVLLVGGWLASRFVYRSGTRWVPFVLVAIAALGLFAAQRATYPRSAHIEWPGAQPRNPWAQAFVWIRENTREDAVFAADPELPFEEGTDMQGFRATAARSLLADDKDQGVAAVVDPPISETWAAQRNAQLGIDRLSDSERMARLRPFGVTWLLLHSDAKTSFPCPYQNTAAKVCRMQQ